MQIVERCFFVVIFAACLVSPAAAAQPAGEWLVADGSARIRIEPCRGALWGVIAWSQNPGTDENNPDPAKRSRSIIGLPILLDMKPAEPNRWEGEVYNAENGKTYNSRISLVKDNVLRIEGCLLGFLCGGENWTRVIPPPASSVQPAAQPPVTQHAVQPPMPQKAVCP